MTSVLERVKEIRAEQHAEDWRRYCDLKKTEAEGGKVSPEEVDIVCRKLGRKLDQFHQDVEQEKGRRVLKGEADQWPAITAEWHAIEAEIAAELERFKKYQEKHWANLEELNEQRREIKQRRIPAQSARNELERTASPEKRAAVDAAMKLLHEANVAKQYLRTLLSSDHTTVDRPGTKFTDDTLHAEVWRINDKLNDARRKKNRGVIARCQEQLTELEKKRTRIEGELAEAEKQCAEAQAKVDAASADLLT